MGEKLKQLSPPSLACEQVSIPGTQCYDLVNNICVLAGLYPRIFDLLGCAQSN